MRYYPLKAARFPGVVAGIRGVKQGPVHVLLVLSDLCNQDCSFCLHRVSNHPASTLFHVQGNYNPNRKIPVEKVMEILDDCVGLGVKAIQLTGGGEPTVHPQFQVIVDGILARGMKYALITNGVLAKKFDLSQASWVRVSLDAGSSETYKRVRRVPGWHWDNALDTIRRIKPGVGFVLTADNYPEVVQATVLVKSMGAAYIRLAMESLNFPAACFQEARRLCQEAQGYEDEGFKVYNRFGPGLDIGTDDPLCGHQYLTTYIGGDLNLYRCCVLSYHPRGLMGTLKDKRFKEAWETADMGVDARDCKACIFRPENEGISNLLEVDDHSFFV